MFRGVALFLSLATLSVVVTACAASDQLGVGLGDGGGSDSVGGGGGAVIGRSCVAHIDCEGEAACLDGVCRRECERSTDCPDPSFTCWGYRCLAAGDGPDTVGGTDAVSGPPCGSWSDCPDQPQGCRDGHCVAPQCYTRGWDQACAGADPGRPYCSLYVCQASDPDGPDTVQPPDVSATCGTWQDCDQSLGPHGCRAGRCVAAECTTDAPCPTGSTCRLFLCESIAPPQDVVQPPEDVVQPPPDVPPPVDVPADVPQSPMLDYGETCDPNSGFPGGGCASELCLYNKNHGSYTCTRECDSSFDCPAPDWCGGTQEDLFLQPFEIDVCIPSDAGQGCAAGCTSSLSFGSGATCVCTQPCESPLNCQPDAACTPSTSGYDLCTPIGHRCTPSAQSDPVCYGMLCYPLDDAGTSGFCTNQCAGPADCPEGWFCYAENVGGGQVVRTCQRAR